MPGSSLRFSPIGVEALDDPGTDPALVARMLIDIAVSNRWLGGAHAMRIGLRGLVGAGDTGRTLTLFDIGTGAADLPLAARRWGARRGVTVAPLALERIPAAARLARRTGTPVVLGCAGALPLRPGSVDIVLLSQMIHHFDPASVVRLLRDCGRIARRGVIVADLRRSWFATPGFRLAATALRLHPVAITDGITSLRRGYSPSQLQALCAESGAHQPTVVATAGSRIVAWWRTDGPMA